MSAGNNGGDAALQDPAAAVVERARGLALRLDLDAVHRYKAENPGSLAIGHLPIYTPRPIIEACGCLPVAVFGGGDEIDIIRGDSYFQSYICHIPRSTVELALTGKLDVLDGMVFPSICDVIRNLSGMWTMLFPDKWSCYLDLPQNFDPSIGGRFYAHELRRMATELHALGGTELTDASLWAAIKAENQRRTAIERLDDLRRQAPHKAPASEAYLVVRAGSVLTANEHAKLVNDYVDGATERAARPIDNVRVVLVGAFCEQPPLSLIIALEKAGCDIVHDDFMHGFRTIEGQISTPDDNGGPTDPIDALARSFLDLGAATSSRYIDQDTKGKALVDAVQLCKADGVIFAAASFCDPALLDQPMLENACAEAEIPYTSFKYSENTGQFQVIREQAGAFSDSVKLWGETAPVEPATKRRRAIA